MRAKFNQMAALAMCATMTLGSTCGESEDPATDPDMSTAFDLSSPSTDDLGAPGGNEDAARMRDSGTTTPRNGSDASDAANPSPDGSTDPGDGGTDQGGSAPDAGGALDYLGPADESGLPTYIGEGGTIYESFVRTENTFNNTGLGVDETHIRWIVATPTDSALEVERYTRAERTIAQTRYNDDRGILVDNEVTSIARVVSDHPDCSGLDVRRTGFFRREDRVSGDDEMNEFDECRSPNSIQLAPPDGYAQCNDLDELIPMHSGESYEWTFVPDPTFEPWIVRHYRLSCSGPLCVPRDEDFAGTRFDACRGNVAESEPYP